MDEKIKETLTAYLDSQSSSQETAQDLRNIIDGSVAEPDEATYNLFQHILDRMRTYAPDSVKLDELTSLLQSLKRLEPTSKVDWSNLIPLGMLIRELWNVSGPGKGDWQTINGFAARLEEGRVLDLANFGIWAMRAALEASEAGEDELAAASAWIQYAGSRMYGLSVQGVLGTTATKGGTRWRGDSGYSLGRWALWKDRLSEISGDDERAAVMLKRMQEIEQ